VRSVTGKDADIAVTIDTLVGQGLLQVLKSGRSSTYTLTEDQTD
jgi:chromosome segregation and condensation protein ScpB